MAMMWSVKNISDWKEAKDDRDRRRAINSTSVTQRQVKWRKPDLGTLKLNVDAAMSLGASSFSIGLVLRDHSGAFVSGKTISKGMVTSVFEAEALAVLEGLNWLLTGNHDSVIIESDSLLIVQALQSPPDDNLLEVGFILDACRSILVSRPGYSISFVKRQANKAAHLVTKLPCSLNCPSVFTSSPNMLLETLMYDCSY